MGCECEIKFRAIKMQVIFFLLFVVLLIIVMNQNASVMESFAEDMNYNRLDDQSVQLYVSVPPPTQCPDQLVPAPIRSDDLIGYMYPPKIGPLHGYIPSNTDSPFYAIYKNPPFVQYYGKIPPQCWMGKCNSFPTDN